jgi:hypothetical protein
LLFALWDYPYDDWMKFDDSTWLMYTSSKKLFEPELPKLLTWRTSTLYELRQHVQTSFENISSNSNSPLINIVKNIGVDVHPDVNDRTLWTAEEYKHSMETLQEHYKDLNMNEIAQFFKKNITKEDMELRISLEERDDYTTLKEHNAYVKSMQRQISEMNKELKKTKTKEKQKHILESIQNTRKNVASKIINMLSAITSKQLEAITDTSPQIDSEPLCLITVQNHTHTNEIPLIERIQPKIPHIETTPHKSPLIEQNQPKIPQIDTTQETLPTEPSQHSPPKRTPSQRSVTRKNQSPSIGQRVEVTFFVKETPIWFPGTVKRVTKTLMNVKFDDGDVGDIPFQKYKWRSLGSL